MNRSFGSKEDGIVILARGYHPVYIFRKGLRDTGTNVIFSYPEVERFACIYEYTVIRVCLATRIIDFQKSKGNQEVIINGKCLDFFPFPVIKNLIFNNSFHHNNEESD